MGFLVALLLVPSVSFANTQALEEKRLELMKQLIVLLEAHLTQLQTLLAQRTGQPIVLGVATSTEAVAEEPTERRRRGGGGGSSRSSNNSETTDTTETPEAPDTPTDTGTSTATSTDPGTDVPTDTGTTTATSTDPGGGQEPDTPSGTSTEPYDATLSISLASGNPDPSVIIVSEDDETDGVEILVFEVTPAGGPVSIDTIVVSVVTGYEGPAETIKKAYLKIGDFIVPAETNPTIDGQQISYVFDTEQFPPLDEDQSYTFTLLVDLQEADGNYTTGQLITAQVTPVEIAGWDAEGYDDLNPSQKISGTAIGSEHILVTEGLYAPLDGLSFETDTLNEDTVGEFTIEFDLLAIGADYYLTAHASTSGTDGITYGVDGTEESLITATLDATADEDSPNVFSVNEGEIETFTLTVTIDPEAAGQFRVYLESLWVSDNPDGITNAEELFFVPVSDYRTSYLFINN